MISIVTSFVNAIFHPTQTFYNVREVKNCQSVIGNVEPNKYVHRSKTP